MLKFVFVRLTWICLVMLTFSSCKQQWQRSKGDISTHFVSLNGFNGLRIGQKFNVYLRNDTALEEGVEIRYFENLVENITLNIHDSVLSIRDENPAKWTKGLSDSIAVVINCHQYSKLKIGGSSKWICLDTLKSGALDIEMNSVQDQHILTVTKALTGKCGNLGKLNLNGFGTIFSWTIEAGGALNAENFRSHDTYLWHYTTHNARVRPERQAFLYLYNSGNVILPDTPSYQLNINTFGSGQVVIKK